MGCPTLWTRPASVHGPRRPCWWALRSPRLTDEETGLTVSFTCRTCVAVAGGALSRFTLSVPSHSSLGCDSCRPRGRGRISASPPRTGRETWAPRWCSADVCVEERTRECEEQLTRDTRVGCIPSSYLIGGGGNRERAGGCNFGCKRNSHSRVFTVQPWAANGTLAGLRGFLQILPENSAQ